MLHLSTAANGVGVNSFNSTALIPFPKVACFLALTSVFYVLTKSSC